MVQVSYPGVYIQEVPSGIRTITPVATSTGAFLGFFPQGPSDEAVEVNGMADFDRVFGGLDKRSEASYAISQFFRNGGTKAQVVRLVNRTAGSDLTVAAAANVRIDEESGGTNVLTVTAASEGAWGNRLRVAIDHSPRDARSFHMRVLRLDAGGAVAATERYLNLSVDPTSGQYFVRVVNQSSSLVRVAHDAFAGGAPFARPAANGSEGAAVNGIENFAELDTGGGGPFDLRLVVRRKSGTDPGPSTDVEELVAEHTATLDFSAGAPASMRELRRALEQAIRRARLTADATRPTDPAFAGATVDLIEGTGATPFRFVLRTNAGRRGYDPREFLHVVQTGEPHLSQLGLTATAAFNVQEYTLGVDFGAGPAFDHRAQAAPATAGGAVGRDGTMPDSTMDVEGTAQAAAFATAILGDPDAKTGLYGLEDADLFNILSVPLAAKLPGPQMTAVVSEALTYCQRRRAFMILDVPARIDTMQEIRDWIDDNAGFRHRNAATYFPRLLIPDPENDFLPRSVGASGTIAGIYARTDSTRGVWKAPAGLDARLRGVSELDFKMTDAENGSINPIGVNAIRVFPVHGQVVWGARTLDGADVAASEWKYVSVRRTALMIEESLFRGTKWVVFEPNDEPTWAKVRQNVGAFMMGLFRQGAFQGSTPEKAFYVKCDGETTTANDRNLGIVNVEVGFAPLKPAEFVVIKIQQIPDVE